tara:strand:+ start:5184 stop:6467 length:1284 start_codon:yes stop_codon:yes gene_type:complete
MVKIMKNENEIVKSYLILKKWWETVELSNFEKVNLNEKIISFNQQLLRLKEKILRIGVCGKSGVGKSTVLNTLLNKEIFITGILNGSTEKIKSKEWFLGQGLIKKIELIDSPGFDACNNLNQTDEIPHLTNLDLVLFIVTGDLNRNEVKALEYLLKEGKKIIIILNKIDIWDYKELPIIIDNIKSKLPNNSSIPIITNSIKSNYKYTHNNNLKDYLVKTINRIGYSLIIYNTFTIANKLVINIKKNRLLKSKEKAQAMIGKFATYKASSVAINPFLFIDISGSFALDTILIKELISIYGLKLKSDSTKKLIKVISLNNIFIATAQLSINSTFNIIKKLSLIAVPFTGGLSLLPYGPVAIAQAVIAVRATKIIGKIAAKEILNRSRVNGLDPINLIDKISIKEPSISDLNKVLICNEDSTNDLSIFLP